MCVCVYPIYSQIVRSLVDVCVYKWLCMFLVDVSLPEVSREDLPLRVQEFLRRDDEELESQLQEQTDEQVSFCHLLYSLAYTLLI